ncbi:Uma2 family endonuclease [Streptomyces sp. NPDC049954]|uniref:Uma2 family endonuclease n=1 Tax=Streptomyces sp. NPDC049954 TaxID=3155779 RepID=UPI0034129351
MGALMSTAAENTPGPQGPEPQEERFAWPTPPAGGWTAEDLDRIPGLPPHTELIDGGLFFMSPQTYFHLLVVRLLEDALRIQVPDDLEVLREMTTRLGSRTRPEPDLMLVPLKAVESLRQSWIDPALILLAVEVVSPESEERDREVKPRKYAAAGIRHYWRVENVDDRPVVYVYELDPATESYAITGIHHDQLRIRVPFPLDIDLKFARRRPPQP